MGDPFFMPTEVVASEVVEAPGQLTASAGVAAIPPTAFYENKSEGAKLVRFAFCKRDETLRGAVERLRGLAMQ